MVSFKVVIGTKDGKCVQKDINEPEARAFINKKIKDIVKGDDIGLAGYEFELTGGSDYCGFPMRGDVTGTSRKRILAVSGVGLKKKAKGIKQRKTVCGNTVHDKITQINLKVTKEGKSPLVEKAADTVEKGDAAEKPAEEKA